MKILLIEDDAGCRVAIEAFVQSHICGASPEFIMAGTLVDGLKQAKVADVVILDLKLPDSRDPEETVSHYAPLFKEIPTIIVSGASELPCVMEAIELGAKAYICKPKLEGLSESLAAIVKALKSKKGN